MLDSGENKCKQNTCQIFLTVDGAKEKMIKITKLRVALIFIGILALIWSVMCIFSIRTCIGLKNPKQVNSKDSSALRAGNIVSVEYEYAFDESLTTGFAFGHNHYYELLKICNKDEFLFCVIIGEKPSFWKDKPYIRMYRELEEFKSEDGDLFVGKVCKTHGSIKKSLIHNTSISLDEKYKHPNTVANTNFDYYIQYIEPDEEVDRLMGRVTFLGILIGLWLIILKKFRQEKDAYQFFLQEECAKERYRIQLSLEKQRKQSSCKAEDDFDDI